MSAVFDSISATGQFVRPAVRRQSSTSDAGGFYIVSRRQLSSNGETAMVCICPETDTKDEVPNEPAMFTQILSLETKRLLAALSVLVEQDGPEYIAQTIDFPLYGSGDTPSEAIEMLKSEIESLYNDLMEDDNFSNEWLTKKKLLSAIVAE